jgi:hypothetical protein
MSQRFNNDNILMEQGGASIKKQTLLNFRKRAEKVVENEPYPGPW